MGWMSPNDLNEDPKRFLGTPHRSHESLLELMEVLFPGFGEKLKAAKVHCLKCEGDKDIPVVMKGSLEPRICNGYVGDPGDLEKAELLNTVGLDEYAEEVSH